MKLLLVGDFHLADSAPASRKDDYRAAGLRKLDQIVELANSSAVDVVLFLGDIFHRKRPNSVSHYLVNEINVRLGRLFSDPYLLVGNHDATAEKALQFFPVSNLNLHRMLEPVVLDGWKFLPYHALLPLDTPIDRLRAMLGDHDPRKSIVLCHIDLLVDLNYYAFGEVSIQDAIAINPAFLFFGHIHKRYGPVMHDNTTVFNPGPVMRTSLDESANDAIAVALIDLDQASFKLHRLAVEPVEAVFKLELAATQKRRRIERSEMVDRLSQMEFPAVSIDNVAIALATTKMSEPARRKAMSLLED